MGAKLLDAVRVFCSPCLQNTTYFSETSCPSDQIPVRGICKDVKHFDSVALMMND